MVRHMHMGTCVCVCPVCAHLLRVSAVACVVCMVCTVSVGELAVAFCADSDTWKGWVLLGDSSCRDCTAYWLALSTREEDTEGSRNTSSEAVGTEDVFQLLAVSHAALTRPSQRTGAAEAGEGAAQQQRRSTSNRGTETRSRRGRGHWRGDRGTTAPTERLPLLQLWGEPLRVLLLVIAGESGGRCWSRTEAGRREGQSGSGFELLSSAG